MSKKQEIMKEIKFYHLADYKAEEILGHKMSDLDADVNVLDYLSKHKKISWEHILKEEGIEDWKVKDSTDGLCMYSIKTILCPKGNDALFLHEIAHVLTHDWNEKMGDKTGHHAIWGDKLTSLISKYMKLK